MSKVTFDYSKAAAFISEDEVKQMSGLVQNAKDVLVAKTGAGNDFLGWIDLPVDYDKEEFARIEKAAEKIVEVRDRENLLSIEELQLKAGLSKAVIDLLRKNGALGGLTETNQLSFF